MHRGLLVLLVCLLFGAGCATWTELGPKGAGRVSAIVATDLNHLWVATPGGGVWKSTDGGANFTWAGNYGLGDFSALHLALDRNDPSRLYLLTWSGFLVSTDGAAHWTRTLYSLPQGDTPYPFPSHLCSSWPACPPFANGLEEPNPYAQMVFSPKNSVIVTSLPCQGLQYSTDGGNHFTQLWPFTSLPPFQRGLSLWQSYTIAQGNGSNRILVRAQDIGSACSDDLGLFHLALVPTEEMASIVWPRAGAGDTVYLDSTLGTMLKSVNARTAAHCADVTFTPVSPPDSLRRGSSLTGPHQMAVQPNDVNRVFVVNVGQVVYSTDGGGSWQASAFPLTAAGGRGLGLSAIMVDEDGVVYVGTQDQGVYTCNDAIHYCDGSPGAGTWTPFALNPAPGFTAPAFIMAITESNPPPAARNFWIATSQGVYRRLAGATTWTAVDAAPLYPYSDVVVDPTCRTRIYTAIGYLNPVTRTRGGAHVSTDNGGTWQSLTSGHPLHNSPIAQVLVDAAHPERVFATTYGRGAWLWVWRSIPSCAP